MTTFAANLPEPASPTSADRPTLRAWYALIVFILATLFGFVDRQILVLVTEPLKQELHLADVQIGLLQGLGPGLFAALGAVALGWIADRSARQIVLAVCILAWSAATAACGLSQSFWQLFLATIGIALGETAIGPVVYSVVPDLFPGKSRVTANFIFFGATTIGGGLGITFGGAALAWIEANRTVFPLALEQLPAWRLAFFTLALPGVPIALAVLAIGPVRRITGQIGEAVSTVASQASGAMARYFAEHWRALLGLYLATSLYGMAQIAVYTWTPVRLVRELGVLPSDVGAGVGAAAIAGAIAGVCLAAAADKLLLKRLGVMTPMWLFKASMAVYLIPLLLQLVVAHPWQVYVLLGIQSTAGTAGLALMPTLFQDISPAAIRTRVIALGGAFLAAATAGAPVLVGAVSDTFSGSPHGLLWAIVLVAAPTVIAGIVSLALVDNAIRRTIAAFAPDATGTASGA